MSQTLNQQISQSLQVYYERGELSGETFGDRLASALQCLRQAEYETEGEDIIDAAMVWLKAEFEWSECSDCGDTYDCQNPDLRCMADGSCVCETCSDDYATCENCDGDALIEDAAAWGDHLVCDYCDHLYGATCSACDERMHEDMVAHCTCKPRKPCKP